MTIADGGKDLDLLCIGETMAVVTPAATRSLRDAEECLLGIGGAESNVAAHVAQLGFRVAWASRVGEDPFGRRITDALSARGVDVQWAARDGQAPTGAYFKEPDTGDGARTYYYRAGSAASRLSAADARQWPLDRTAWVHLSGITPALSPGCDELADHILRQAKHHGYLTSFDVNYRPALWTVSQAAPRLLELANQAHTVLVGLDEARALWGCDTAEDVAALITRPLNLVVKDAAHEAVEFARTGCGSESVHRLPANKIEVVEPVGAGDAFAAGYLAGLLRGGAPADRLGLGHSLAAWTLGSRADFRPDHGPAIRTYAHEQH